MTRDSCTVARIWLGIEIPIYAAIFGYGLVASGLSFHGDVLYSSLGISMEAQLLIFFTLLRVMAIVKIPQNLNSWIYALLTVDIFLMFISFSSIVTIVVLSILKGYLFVLVYSLGGILPLLYLLIHFFYFKRVADRIEVSKKYKSMVSIG